MKISCPEEPAAAGDEGSAYSSLARTGIGPEKPPPATAIRSCFGRRLLHPLVVRAAAAFGDDPIDNLIRVGDVAGLAMHAIRGVDFQLHAAVRFLGHLVHRSRTKILARIPVFHDALCGADVRVRDAKMARLIFLMPRPRVIYVRQPVKRQFAIALESFGSCPPVDLLVRLMPRVRPHRIDQPASAADLLERCVKKSAEHSMLERLMKIPYLPQLFLDVALLDLLRESAQCFRR